MARGGPVPWNLDPAEHPRDVTVIGRASVGGEHTGKQIKEKKEEKPQATQSYTEESRGRCKPKFVTGSSSDSSSSDESDTTVADSGVNLASPVSIGPGWKKAKVTDPSIPAAGLTISCTPPLSPDTRQRLDEETQGGNETQPG